MMLMRAAFHAELHELIAKLARMVGLASQMMTNASIALHQSDLALAGKVISDRDHMNAMLDSTERRCITLLACRPRSPGTCEWRSRPDVALPLPAREGWFLGVVGSIDPGTECTFRRGGRATGLPVRSRRPGLSRRCGHARRIVGGDGLGREFVADEPGCRDVRRRAWHRHDPDAHRRWLHLGGRVGSLALLSRTRRALGAHAGLFWARIWQHFSVLALTVVGAMFISGSWLAWKHVGGVSEFATTTYGRFLLVKLLLVLALVSAGAYNQFLLTPRIARSHAAGEIGKGFILTLRHFPAVVAAEAALGVCVLFTVPFLTGSVRAQAGDGAAPTVDGTILALGLVLVASLGATFYAAHRASLLLIRRAEVSGGCGYLRPKT
ncbi:MAG: hypothetical protein DLM61_12680 [Pseudonocardiales bacterium]|nr:MAG: hypothetical protein DLM61_12680 [Pseudonocardiales bacterium]